MSLNVNEKAAYKISISPIRDMQKHNDLVALRRVNQRSMDTKNILHTFSNGSHWWSSETQPLKALAFLTPSFPARRCGMEGRFVPLLADMSRLGTTGLRRQIILLAGDGVYEENEECRWFHLTL